MKKAFPIFLFFFLSAFLLSAQTIGEIHINGLKKTKEEYLLKMAGLSVGGNWTPAIKSSAKTKIAALKKIVESVEITEAALDDGNIAVTITVQEKFSVLIVPFLTYGNQAGIKPKIIFRDYNVAGYGKYFGAKAEFVCDTAFAISAEYNDYQFLNREDMNFSLLAKFSTSAPNYTITDYAPDLGPIGSTSWTGGRWEDNNTTKFDITGQYNYNLPWRNAVFSTNAAFKYTYIEADDDKSHDAHYETPIHQFIPNTAVSITVPLALHFTITPYASFAYRVEHNKEPGLLIAEDLTAQSYYGQFLMYATPYFQTTFSVPFQSIGLTYTLTPGMGFYIGNHFFKSASDMWDPQLREFFKECALNLSLKNTVTRTGRLAPGLTYNFGLTNTIYQRAFHYKTAYSEKSPTDADPESVFRVDDAPWKSVENTIQIETHLTYNMDYAVYKRHLFSMKFRLFYYYNAMNTKDDYKGIDESIYSPVVRRVWEQDCDYEMFQNLGNFCGYAGGMLNLGYRLPLFTFKTPNFLGFSMKRELTWDADLSFFLDVGLAQNYDEIMRDSDFNDFIINMDFLHLCPGLATGIKLEVAPRFMPVKAVVSLGVDVYKMLKTKAFNSNLVLVIGIDNQ